MANTYMETEAKKAIAIDDNKTQLAMLKDTNSTKLELSQDRLEGMGLAYASMNNQTAAQLDGMKFQMMIWLQSQLGGQQSTLDAIRAQVEGRVDIEMIKAKTERTQIMAEVQKAKIDARAREKEAAYSGSGNFMAG